MLQQDNTLKSYRRLRPTWKQMANAVDRITIGKIYTKDHQENDGNGDIPFVADGFWMLTNATLPEGLEVKVMERDLKPDDPIAKKATKTDYLIFAEPIAIRTYEDKVSFHGEHDILILRTAGRDIGVNPRKARWVERHGKDKGRWFAEESRFAPLRYIVDGKVAGLLMPYAYEARYSGKWRYESWGIKWNEETRRYELL